LARQLADYADRKRVPQALVVETALSSYLSPDNSERMEAALGRRLDPAALVSRHFGNDREAVRFFSELLVQDAFDPAVTARITATAKNPRDAATLVLTTPEYPLA
jgi:hypothetical protein